MIWGIRRRGGGVEGEEGRDGSDSCCLSEIKGAIREGNYELA